MLDPSWGEPLYKLLHELFYMVGRGIQPMNESTFETKLAVVRRLAPKFSIHRWLVAVRAHWDEVGWTFPERDELNPVARPYG